MSGDQLSDRMKKSGEYIYGVYPGEETSRFINRISIALFDYRRNL